MKLLVGRPGSRAGLMISKARSTIFLLVFVPPESAAEAPADRRRRDVSACSAGCFSAMRNVGCWPGTSFAARQHWVWNQGMSGLGANIANPPLLTHSVLPRADF